MAHLRVLIVAVRVLHRVGHRAASAVALGSASAGRTIDVSDVIGGCTRQLCHRIVCHRIARVIDDIVKAALEPPARIQNVEVCDFSFDR